MKTAKLFLSGMYLHLVLSIAVPLGILCFSADRGWNSASIGIFLFYLFMIVVIQLIGWMCVAMAAKAYRHGESALLRRSLKILKLYSIPFYVLNFSYSCLAWFVLIGASRGILFLLVPIPVLVTCMMIFQSGCVGICYVMCLRRQPENRGKPSGIHYLLQLISVLDVVSTVMLLRRYPGDANLSNPMASMEMFCEKSVVKK